MKTKQLFPIMMIACAAIFVSCSKEGPAGPAGATGAAGAAGATGPAGATGAAGTTNVIYSTWANAGATGMTAWKDTTMAYVGKCFRGIRSETKLTQAMLDNGVILGYISNFGTVSPLPVTAVNAVPSTYFGYIPVVGKIIFYNAKVDESGGLNLGADVKFRYVLIPGSTLTSGRVGTSERFASLRGRSYTEGQLKKMSYREICNLLNIVD